MNTRMMRAIVMSLLMMLGPAAFAQSQPPEQAALQFYRWYMLALAIDDDPLRHSTLQMEAFVDQGLVKDLKRRTQRKGLYADYFIQAQDYMEDWTTDIRAVRPVVQGNLASVVVILGATAETKRILALTLTRSSGVWKICMVRLV
jgi:hypothetical protein